MDTWTIHDVFAVGAVIVAVIANFFFLRYCIKRFREELDYTKNKAKTTAERLETHEKEEDPHKSCERHMDKIENHKDTLDKKVDKELCNLVHENLNNELKDIKESLKPLTDIKAVLLRLEKQMNGE